MRVRMQWDVEVLDESTQRVKVFGGWIIRSRNEKLKCESMVFLPDNNHQWHIAPPPADPAIERANVAKDFEAPK